MIEIHYFASIRETLGRAQDRLELTPDITSIATLMEKLVSLYGERWDSALRQGRVLVAINQTMARSDTLIRDGDEVAFFPPVSGG